MIISIIKIIFSLIVFPNPPVKTEILTIEVSVMMAIESPIIKINIKELLLKNSDTFILPYA